MKKSLAFLGLALVLALARPNTAMAQRGCHGEHFGGAWNSGWHGAWQGGGYAPRPYYAPAPPPVPSYSYGPGPCAPGFQWIWIPPHWIRTPYGDQWIDGHWERRRAY